MLRIGVRRGACFNGSRQQ